MESVVVIFIFLLGLLVGSFLNVLIVRQGIIKSISGRSSCVSCGSVLSWYELIPVLSFLVLRARCLKCKSPISIQYPLVEITTGILFVISWVYSSSIFSFLFLAILLCLSIIIFVNDLYYKIIPDIFVYTFALITFISLFVDLSVNMDLSFVLPSLNTLLAGPALALLFFAIWFFSKGRAMGLGDAKLMLGAGWLLGGYAGFSALVLSFWLGAFVCILLIIFNKFKYTQLFKSDKKITIKTEVPFAPFIIVSIWTVYFFNFSVFNFSFNLFF